MAFLARHPRARWAAPVVAAALMVGGVATAQSSFGGQSDLAPRTAHDLLVALQGVRPTPLSGTVVQTMDLGMPALPTDGLAGAGAGGSLSPLTLLSGTHTWRVWYADPTHARLALIDGTSEYDVVRNGSDVWQWSSTDQSVVHATVPQPTPDGSGDAVPTPPTTGATGLPDLSNPDAVASWALAQVGPTTEVTTTTTDMVAGRPAYGLVLTPRTSDTLVGSVHLSLDAATSVPLAATVTPRGATVPAVDVRYSKVTFGTPSASVFAFTPPPGATVTSPKEGGTTSGSGPSDGTGKRQQPTTTGTGWTTVVVGTLPTPTAGQDPTTSSDPLGAVRTLLPRVSGSWGSGYLLTTRLLSAVLTDDGRVAVGAVAPSALYAALQR